MLNVANQATATQLCASVRIGSQYYIQLVALLAAVVEPRLLLEQLCARDRERVLIAATESDSSRRQNAIDRRAVVHTSESIRSLQRRHGKARVLSTPIPDLVSASLEVVGSRCDVLGTMRQSICRVCAGIGRRRCVAASC
jgi:hypothetical protein